HPGRQQAPCLLAGLRPALHAGSGRRSGVGVRARPRLLHNPRSHRSSPAGADRAAHPHPGQRAARLRRRRSAGHRPPGRHAAGDVAVDQDQPAVDGADRRRRDGAEMTARGERMRQMTRRHKLLIAAIIAYLLVPTLVVVPISFSAGSTFKFPPESFSLQWWQRLIESEQWLRAALNSLKVGAIAAPLATVMGTAAAFGLSRVAPEKRNRLLGFIAAPLIIPKILVALAVYGAFLTFRLNGTLIGIALGHTAIAIPYVVVAV